MKENLNAVIVVEIFDLTRSLSGYYMNLDKNYCTHMRIIPYGVESHLVYKLSKKKGDVELQFRLPFK